MPRFNNFDRWPGASFAAINTFLLPPALRPNWLIRGILIVAGGFFISLSVLAASQRFGLI